MILDFEITRKLYCNLKILKSQFSHEIIDKITPPPNVSILQLFV